MEKERWSFIPSKWLIVPCAFAAFKCGQYLDLYDRFIWQFIWKDLSWVFAFKHYLPLVHHIHIYLFSSTEFTSGDDSGVPVRDSGLSLCFLLRLRIYWFFSHGSLCRVSMCYNTELLVFAWSCRDAAWWTSLTLHVERDLRSCY